jgi:glycosyltransferase involved in cell wall biosynthesis
MINGVVPVATSVDGVPEHIKHGENGLLIYNAQDEEGVVQQLVQHIIYLCNNRQHLIAMSLNAHEYAKNTFSPQSFCGNYRRVMKLDE